MKIELTGAEAGFIANALACRIGSICDAIEDTADMDERTKFIAQMEEASDLRVRLTRARYLDDKERNSAQ